MKGRRDAPFFMRYGKSHKGIAGRGFTGAICEIAAL